MKSIRFNLIYVLNFVFIAFLEFEDHFAKHEINNSRSSKSHLASSVLLLYSFMFDIYGIPITIYKMGFQISSPLEWSQSQTNASVSSVRLLTVTCMIYLKTLHGIAINILDIWCKTNLELNTFNIIISTEYNVSYNICLISILITFKCFI